MEQISPILTKLSEENPNVRFIVDNYDILIRAHKGKTILVMDEEIVKVFDNDVEAVLFAHRTKLNQSLYAIKKCSGPVDALLIVPNGK